MRPCQEKEEEWEEEGEKEEGEEEEEKEEGGEYNNQLQILVTE